MWCVEKTLLHPAEVTNIQKLSKKEVVHSVEHVIHFTFLRASSITDTRMFTMIFLYVLVI